MRDHESFPQWVYDIVEGPENCVISWPVYFTRGYLFHTQDHGRTKKTMNYGVCVKGQNYSEDSEEDDFYGILENIIELQYPGFFGLKITLFYCKWYDPTIDKGTRIRDGGIVDVLESGKYGNYEPYILGSQADQVCYLPYPCIKRKRKVWLSVLKVNPRNVVQGKFINANEVVILQQTTDDGLTGLIEELVVDSLVVDDLPDEFIDFEIDDAEAEDEFQCNVSTSEEEDDDDEDDDDDDVNEDDEN